MPTLIEATGKTVAIIDYGLGNLFSVRQACEHSGLKAHITSEPSEITAADAVILPGVGAFSDAMDNLRALDLVSVIKDVAESGTPLLGICLGMQLLLDSSSEFGSSVGLGLVRGTVVQFPDPSPGATFKVPQVGWNRVYQNEQPSCPDDVSPMMTGVPDGAYMYFVHSFYTAPDESRVVTLFSNYADITFCSGIRSENIIGFQFHPERSGPVGLRIYRNFAKQITATP
jgi:imidazole glycerol-phosphate synthase subunit HisH